MLVKSAGFVVFRRNPDIEYLFLQASYGKNQWSPPKGQVDEGESEFKTALREAHEEAGLVEDDLKIYKEVAKTVEYVNRKGLPKTCTLWLAEMVKDTPIKLSDEHLDYKWLQLSEAVKLSEHMDLGKALHECNHFISSKY